MRFGVSRLGRASTETSSGRLSGLGGSIYANYDSAAGYFGWVFHCCLALPYCVTQSSEGQSLLGSQCWLQPA
ncbi:hypothetical protein DPMN_056573 [Dreissena polymorpha]|uniref:Uncharacterized protein n=1 Tax=Dreissena polymorpha TaxID=45954 RepID=A0A9D4CUN0_DREPO|nr:hypothetical protein DPMN_056573 [Dreissena polymorpha]